MATRRARQPDTVQRPGGKLGVILGRLEGKTGGTLDELVEATGWQRHSVRGALSRLRGRGFAIHLELKKGRKAYRLA
jgi:DNA-binding transcriptional regulator PaaX